MNDDNSNQIARIETETFATLDSTWAQDSIWVMKGRAFENLEDFTIDTVEVGFDITIIFSEDEGGLYVDVEGLHSDTFDRTLLFSGQWPLATNEEIVETGVRIEEAQAALENAYLNTGGHPEVERLSKEALNLYFKPEPTPRDFAIIVFKSDLAVHWQEYYDRLVNNFEDHWEDITLEVLTSMDDDNSNQIATIEEVKIEDQGDFSSTLFLPNLSQLNTRLEMNTGYTYPESIDQDLLIQVHVGPRGGIQQILVQGQEFVGPKLHLTRKIYILEQTGPSPRGPSPKVHMHDFEFTCAGPEIVVDIWTVNQPTIEDPLYLVTMLGGTIDFDSIIIETTIGFPFPEIVGTNVIIPTGMDEVYLSKVSDFNNLDHYGRTMFQLQEAVESLEEVKGTTEEDVVLSEALLDLFLEGLANCGPSPPQLTYYDEDNWTWED